MGTVYGTARRVRFRRYLGRHWHPARVRASVPRSYACAPVDPWEGTADGLHTDARLILAGGCIL